MGKIVVHCASGLKNSGDEAILSALLKVIPGGYDVAVISFDAEYTQKLHAGIKAFSHKDRATCRNLIKTCDLFILGGGGLLQDETTIFNVSRWLSKLKLALKYGRKTFLYANSIGPLRYAYNQRQVASVLKKVDRITLRDHASYRLLTELGVKDNVRVTADPVFSFEPPEAGFSEKVLKKYALEEGYVFVSVRHWFDTHPFIPVKICNRFNIRSSENSRKYKRFISEMAKITEFIGNNLEKKVVFVSFCAGRDAKTATDILSLLDASSYCISLDEADMKPQEYMALIRRSDFVLGMRLHSLIYSFVSETPFIALSYSQKVQGLLKDAGLQDYSVSAEAVTLKEFEALYGRLSRNREELKGRIRNSRETFLNYEQENGALLSLLLRNHEKTN